MADSPDDANGLRGRVVLLPHCDAAKEGIVAWPWIIVDILREVFEEHPELRLEELARHAQEAELAGDHVRAIDNARTALRQALSLLASTDVGIVSSLDTARRRVAGGAPVTGLASMDHGATTVRCILRLDGDYWTVGREDRLVRLRDSVGLRDLAQLLRNPGRGFAAVELAAGRFGGQVIESDVGDILDARAKREYLRRVDELRDELAEAERLGDLGRASRFSTEIEIVLGELGCAIGRGRRSRRLGSPAERARVNVTRTIRAAIHHIAERDPWLGRYLARAIRTGAYCCYIPDPDASVCWVFK